MITNEPVRGGFPDPSFYSSPGIDQARAYLRGLVPRAPLGHLVGLRPTQVGSGSATGTMPASPWLQNIVGTLDLSTLIDATFALAVLTGAPPAHEVQTATLSVHHLRPCTVESETLVARARVLNTGRRFTLAEVLVEDGLGRAVAHATASMLIRPMEPSPPPTLGTPTAVEAPVYSTPDPYLRPIPTEGFPSSASDERPPLPVLRRVIAGELPEFPAHQLLGVRLVEGAEGMLSLTMRTSEWLCSPSREVLPGVIASLSFFASSGVVYTLSPGGHGIGVLDESVSFLRPVLPDGRELLARGTVTHRSGELLISGAEVTDADGNAVAVGHSTALLTPRRGRAPSGAEPERVLATVLFTDIVGSTERAEELGDARWGELLEEHHGLVRKQLQLFKGREVKTTGDGFLATFDSPGRAVQCARAIRDGVWRLGLEVRAGLHTGECEVSGTDVAGIAVHLASRVQSLAGPGEILVSSTVRDLVAGSGLRFADRGRHQLKGIEGDWPIFAVTD